jgi:hypothetical protein
MQPGSTLGKLKALACTLSPPRLASTLSKTLPLKGTMLPSGRMVRAFTS